MDKQRNLTWISNGCWYNFRKVMLISFVFLVLLTSMAEGILKDQYLGCFYDNSSTPLTKSAQWKILYIQEEMTIELCINSCMSLSSKTYHTYARIQNGTDCMCEDEYGIQQVDSLCNLPCGGNQSEYCGGRESHNDSLPYYVLYSVCPIGSYGPSCDTVCHCKQQMQCQRNSGKCPDGCDGNYTGPSCNNANISEQYIGCYKDVAGKRAMEIPKGRLEYRHTVLKCVDWCITQDSSYAGPEFGSECFCGEVYAKYGKIDEIKCNTKCEGNKSQTCGGGGAMSVYSVCPFGYYGEGCRKRCNCKTDKSTCVFRNGSCPSSECKSGWIGSSCNVRDCKINNGDCKNDETCLAIDLKYASVFGCRCLNGFRRTQLWTPCEDIDECSEIPSLCGEHAINCINTNGSYLCVCENDNTVQNTTCVPIPETGSNVGTFIGTILGVLCLVAILAVFIILYFCRFKRSKNEPSVVETIHDYQYVSNIDVAVTSQSHVEQDTNTHDQAPIYSSVLTKQQAISTVQLTDVIRSKMSAPGSMQKEFKVILQSVIVIWFYYTLVCFSTYS